MNECIETEKRLRIVHTELERLKTTSIGVILAGSLAYGPSYSITKDSDIDLLVVVKQLKEFIPFIELGDVESINLSNRFFDGYCIKKVIEEVPISYHFLSEDAFDIITKCFVADIRVFRESAKNEIYNLYGFERNHYSYTIKNVSLEEFKGGVRTIVPIGFINSDRYFLGIHRDKIICNGKILHDTKDFIANAIDKLWINVAQNLCDESYRLYGEVNVEKMNIINTMAKKDKLSAEIVNEIKLKSEKYIKKYLKSNYN